MQIKQSLNYFVPPARKAVRRELETMLYIVDGTGPLDDRVYETHMAGGFCKKMNKQFGGHYFRGPDITGRQTYDIAKTVFGEIKANSQLGRESLFLAGHSRGGATVIDVAKRLQKDGRPVDALFLFDAVDKTANFRDTKLVPRNVKVTYHARRDTSISNYFEWGARNSRREFEDCLKTQVPKSNHTPCEGKRLTAVKYRRLDDAMKVRMRASYIRSLDDGMGIDFGNCGLGLEAANGLEEIVPRYLETLFLGSHGALGGSPIGEQDGAWRSKEDQVRFESIKQSDRAAIASVWAWMSKNFDESQLKLHAGVRSSNRPPEEAAR